MVGDEETDRDTIVFHFDVECSPKVVIKPNGDEAYENETAYSSALSWLPQGNQEEMFPGTVTLIDLYLCFVNNITFLLSVSQRE